jgi:hypothetical protein
MPRSDLERSIKELDSLRKRGVITEDEYEARRAVLITDTGTAQPAKRRGMPRWLKVLGVFAGLLLVLVIVAALLGDSTDETTTSSTGSTPPDRAAAQPIDPRVLVADPQAVKGQNIILQGQALNVDQRDNYTWVQLMAQVPERGVTESIVVEVRPKDATLLSQECYRVYGVVEGTQKVRRTLTGATDEVPLVRGYATESAPRGPSNIGCAAP